MKVEDFMITDVISVHKDTTVKDLLNLLIEHRIGGVPVVDDDNHLVGMVSDGDVLRYLTPKAQSVHDLFYTVYVEDEESEQEVLSRKINETVGSMLHRKHIYTVQPDDLFEEAIRLLSHHHFKKLPVTDENNNVVGVISRGDIIYNISKLIVAK